MNMTHWLGRAAHNVQAAPLFKAFPHPPRSGFP